jgi:hypothetical protein
MRSRGKRLAVIAPLAILGMAFFLAAGGEVVKLLWNWLLPTLFGWPRIGFWQAIGLLALSRILFGGFGSHRSGVGRHWRRRWDRMSPEEREKFRERFRERWGFVPPSREPEEG